MIKNNNFNNYREVLDFLFSQLPMYQRSGPAAYKADLGNTLKLDQYFHHPHQKYKTIHVAGTNGKGSVSHMLASVFQEAGFKTGLYTSPHLKDFRERIKINGRPVPQAYVIKFINRHYSLFSKIKPSFFEMTAALAFQYFADEKIDLAVIETGLGGRLDSTNIIHPVCSVITNIGMDHTQFLGDTLAQIAGEKAGIIKDHIPVVVGKSQPETEPVFRKTAKEHHSKIFFSDRNFFISYSMFTPAGNQLFNVHKKDGLWLDNLETGLSGNYQKENVITVLQTIETIKNIFPASITTIRKGLKNVIPNTGLHGRWEVLSHHPLIICDAGHNPEAFAWILDQINNTPYKKLYMVLGFVNDKHYHDILGMLPRHAFYYFTQARIPRALPVKDLYHAATQYGLEGTPVETVKQAYDQARQTAGKYDFIFIGGSTFVVAEVI